MFVATKSPPVPAAPPPWLRGRRFRTLLGGACLLVATLGSGATPEQEEQIKAIYTPYRVEQAALAPDGRHVAFVVRGERGFELQIHDTEDADKKINVRLDAKPPTAIHFLAWATPGQLVVATDSLMGVVDPEDGRIRKLAEARTFQGETKLLQSPPTLQVLGLTAGADPQLLVQAGIAKSPGVVSLELHQVNVATGAHQRTFAEEQPAPGGSLITDRHGRVRLTFLGGGVPQRFHYRGPEAGAAVRNLDELLADRADFAFVVTPENFIGERTLPLGFGEDENLLYFASNLGRDTYGLRGVDLRTKRCTGFLAGGPAADLVDLNAPWLKSPLVFDRQRGTLAGVRFNGPVPTAHWLDPEIAARQTALQVDFPGRTVQLLEWDATREHFLVLVTGNSDPGRYFVHDRRTGLHREYFRQAPSLDPALGNPAGPFSFSAATGGRVSGWLTWPQAPAAVPPPVVVWLHDGPLRRGPAGYSRDAQALATLGFAVIEINYAGAEGEGRVRREALRGAYDQAPVREVLAALDWLGTQRTIDRARVAVVGEGYGGYLALRALQLQPGSFRCGVTINGVTDLTDFWQTKIAARGRSSGAVPTSRGGSMSLEELAGSGEVDAIPGSAQLQTMDDRRPGAVDFDREFIRWFSQDGPPLAGLAVLREVDRLTRPVFLLADPGDQRAPIASTRALLTALRRLKRAPEYQELTPKLSREKMILQVGTFLKTQFARPADGPGRTP